MRTKKIQTVILFLIFVHTSYAQSVFILKEKFQKIYDTTRFKPNVVSNGFSTTYIVANPTLSYTIITNPVFQTFSDSFLIKVEGQNRDGKRQGIFTYSLIDKNNPAKTYKLYKQSFKDDELSGVWETFSVDGKLVMYHTYVSGKQLGLQQDYKADGSILGETEIMKDGKYIMREYYASNKLMTETPFKDNKPHGTGKKFYENGRLEDQVIFKNGDMDGIRKYYYSNGQLWIEQLYVANKPWTIIGNYDDKGKRRDGGTLKDGNGTQIFYNEDGTIRETLHYKNGVEVK